MMGILFAGENEKRMRQQRICQQKYCSYTPLSIEHRRTKLNQTFTVAWTANSEQSLPASPPASSAPLFLPTHRTAYGISRPSHVKSTTNEFSQIFTLRSAFSNMYVCSPIRTTFCILCPLDRRIVQMEFWRLICGWFSRCGRSDQWTMEPRLRRRRSACYKLVEYCRVNSLPSKSNFHWFQQQFQFPGLKFPVESRLQTN